MGRIRPIAEVVRERLALTLPRATVRAPWWRRIRAWWRTRGARPLFISEPWPWPRADPPPTTPTRPFIRGGRMTIDARGRVDVPIRMPIPDDGIPRKG